MNKYQKALNTIVDAIRDYISYRESDLLPSENEIYGAMALLRKLVNKADSFEWIPFENEEGYLYCKIPSINQQILVSDGKDVWIDTWIKEDDEELYKLESEIDLDGLAWMPLPKYKGETLK